MATTEDVMKPNFANDANSPNNEVKRDEITLNLCSTAEEYHQLMNLLETMEDPPYALLLKICNYYTNNKKNYKFKDLILNPNFYAEMNVRAINASFEMLHKMDETLWDLVANIYEKLRTEKELKFVEILLFVCKVIVECYGSNEIETILFEYDKINVSNAVLLLCKYLLSSYHEAYIMILNSNAEAKVTNKKKVAKHTVEVKKGVTTKQKVQQINNSKNDAKSASNKMHSNTCNNSIVKCNNNKDNNTNKNNVNNKQTGPTTTTLYETSETYRFYSHRNCINVKSKQLYPKPAENKPIIEKKLPPIMKTDFITKNRKAVRNFQRKSKLHSTICTTRIVNPKTFSIKHSDSNTSCDNNSSIGVQEMIIANSAECKKSLLLKKMIKDDEEKLRINLKDSLREHFNRALNTLILYQYKQNNLRPDSLDYSFNKLTKNKSNLTIRYDASNRPRWQTTRKKRNCFKRIAATIQKFFLLIPQCLVTLLPNILLFTLMSIYNYNLFGCVEFVNNKSTWIKGKLLNYLPDGQQIIEKAILYFKTPKK